MDRQRLIKLVAARDCSEAPHLINEQMNAAELARQETGLLSYPTYMAINLIGTCNAHCQFCYWSEEYSDRSKITIQDIKKMEWLKNVSVIDLYGGVGEPLMNKDFINIVHYMKKQNPGQKLYVTTNGQLLTPNVSQYLAGKLDKINISINAATKETYEELMLNCSWNVLMGNLEYFQSINQKMPQPTQVSFSFVSNLKNIKELYLLAGIAKDNNISAVGVSHFCAGGVRPKRKQKRLSMENCLYYSPELYDKEIKKTQREFAKYNIRLGHPPLFSENSVISLGARSIKENKHCAAPWQTAFINPDPGGKWISCCCSINSAHMDITPFSVEQDFMETWNSDLFRTIRSEVNADPTKLINCEYCKTYDKSDPQNSCSQLHMMAQATEQFYDCMGISLTKRAKKEIGYYLDAIEVVAGQKTKKGKGALPHKKDCDCQACMMERGGCPFWGSNPDKMVKK